MKFILSYIVLQSIIFPIYSTAINDKRAQKLFSVKNNSGEITAMRFSPDLAYIAVADSNGAIRFWNLNTREYVTRLSLHNAAISFFEYSPDGKYLISLGRDKKLNFVHVQERRVQCTISTEAEFVPGASISPDNKSFVTISKSKYLAIIYDSNSCKQIKSINLQNNVATLKFGFEGQELVVGWEYTGQGDMSIWELNSGKLKKSFGQTGDGVYRLTDSKSIIAAGSRNGPLQVWKKDNFLSVMNLTEDGNKLDQEVYDIAISPSEMQIAATYSFDCKAAIWELASRRMLLRVEKHKLCTNIIGFKNESELLYAEYLDKEISVYKLSPTSNGAQQNLPAALPAVP